jgi:hypothetical protein
MKLLERMRTGLREMPSNAVWLLGQALSPVEVASDVAGSAAAGARDRRRRVAAAVADATPFGGDSVEIRARRAKEATERAREAEERALEAAQESKARAPTPVRSASVVALG